MKRLAASPLLIPLILFAGCANPSTAKGTRLIMDTVVSITLAAPGRTAAVEPAMKSAFSEIERIAKLLDKYDQESECARVNRLKPGEAMALSDDLAYVVRKAKAVNKLTNGAFDITLSPLIDLWNSYKPKGEIPENGEITKALSNVGSDYIVLKGRNRINFAREGVRIDLSGIGKGYAVDAAVRALKANGIENALVDAGGDIYCLGPGPGGKGWHIGIRHPREPKALLGALYLKDKAVATSGDYQNYCIVGSRRYSHILDPKTGYPAVGGPISVTVVTQDGITADALATAISAMDTRAGLALAETLESVEAVIVSQDDNGGLRVFTTSGLENLYEDR